MGSSETEDFYMIKGYLVISSVILHLLILLSLFWIIPFFSKTAEMGAAQFDSFQDPEVGVIEDVSTISRDAVSYNGYKIRFNEDTLYVAGTGDEIYRVGDEVDLSITEHLYKPLNSLMITILRVSR